MIPTFVDAGVLIAAATLRDPDLGQVAIAILDDPNRTFIGSGFLRLEVMPKAVFHRRSDEADFYERYFRRARLWSPTLETALEKALTAARTWGLNAMDALHVAAAIDTGADEFLTTERPTTPLFRVTAFRSIGLFTPQATSPDSESS